MKHRVVKILPGLFFVQRGFLSGNHFVLKAERPVLIDTAYASGTEDTLSAIASLGCDWRRTGAIINTHCHCDHVGANRLIQEESGCSVHMHPTGRRIVNEKNGREAWYDYYRQTAEFFDCTHQLEDGEEIAVGEHRFTAVHAPGHSRDTLTLFSREHGVLISSDALWASDMAVVTAAIEGEDAAEVWLATLEKLGALKVGIVYPGHGPEFTGFAEAVERTRARLERFAANPAEAADDLLRKITVYTLLMRRGFDERAFEAELMATPWFPETIDRYFGGNYGAKYAETLERLSSRGAVKIEGGRITAKVPA